MEQVERIHLELGPDWGPPHIAHMVLSQVLKMRERLDIRIRAAGFCISSVRPFGPSGRNGEVGVLRRIEDMERELSEAGHEVERSYEFGGQDTRDGDGWVVKVDGKVVATGGSLGRLEGSLREWFA